jgi:photosystem II 13kDa protein
MDKVMLNKLIKQNFMAQIQFSVGITETVVPDVKLTRSKSGTQSTASFYKAKFINGKPAALEVLYIMNSTAEWDRFMRFMERYSEANGLGLKKAE